MQGSFPGVGKLQPDTPQSAYELPLVFTGSGSEYFRIWIVNLLLTLVTLGIYYPWAKVRRLRYFHANTLVGGEPMAFHADPKKMFKGYALVAVMLALYSVAGQFSAVAGFVAFAIVAAIWPALLKSSFQFRMANTSWRGLRFRFNGSVGGAYRAVVPLFIPGLVVLASLIGVDNPEKPPVWYGLTILAVMLTSLLILPWLMWNLKQYQHNHYALATQQTTFKASLSSFYSLIFKTIGIVLLPLLAAAGLVLLVRFFVLQGDSASVADAQSGPLPSLIIMAVVAGISALVISMVIAKPYFTARLQNLVWSRTGNASLRFISELRFRSVLGLTLKNWLLMLLTLGFYWPFAAIAMARLRLQAVYVKTRIHPDTLVSQMQVDDTEAAGDAAGDLFGLDIGL